MSLQLSVFILCLSFLLVALAAVPFLLQLWRTMKTLETTLQTLNRTLPGLLENLEAITLNLRHVTRTVDVQMERLALAVDRASFGLGVLWNLKSVLLTGSRMPLIRRIRTLRALGRESDLFQRASGLSSRTSRKPANFGCCRLTSSGTPTANETVRLMAKMTLRPRRPHPTQVTTDRTKSKYRSRLEGPEKTSGGEGYRERPSRPRIR